MGDVRTSAAAAADVRSRPPAAGVPGPAGRVAGPGPGPDRTTTYGVVRMMGAHYTVVETPNPYFVPNHW